MLPPVLRLDGARRPGRPRPSRRRRPVLLESLEPRVVPTSFTTFTEVAPNNLANGGQPQQVFGAANIQINGNRTSGSDDDGFLFNADAATTLTVHFITAPGLSMSYSVHLWNDGTGPPDSPQALVHGASDVSFDNQGNPQVTPPTDATAVVPTTGVYMLNVQGGSVVTDNLTGVVAGQLTGSYSVQITGADPVGDVQVHATKVTDRHLEFSYLNSTPHKVSFALYYAKGPSPSTIIGKPVFKVPLAATYVNARFGGGGLFLKKRPPKKAEYIIGIANKGFPIPESDPTNDVFAIHL